MANTGVNRRYGVTRTLVGMAAALLFAETAWSIAPPNAPATSSTGSYTVTYPHYAANYVCDASRLEFRGPTSSSWTTISTNSSNGTVHVSGQSTGIYEYRSGIYCEHMYGDSTDDISSSVFVQVGPTPEVDSLAEQLLYEYQSRTGDLNGDGLVDILIQRLTSPGNANGTIDTLILQQAQGGNFNTIVPNNAQLAIANQWPISDIHLSVVDVNLDGFADVFLRDLDDVIPGANSQIAFAPANVFQTSPLGVTSLDATVRAFLTDFRNWAESFTYFDDNAILVESGYWQTVYDCETFWWGDSQQTICYEDQEWVEYEYLSYNHFNQYALTLFALFPDPGSSIDLVAGSDAAAQIEHIFETIFGVEIFGGVLGSGGVNPWEVEFGLGGDDDRGRALIWRIFDVSEEITDRRDWRYLTAGEKDLVLDNGITIPGIDDTRVFRKKYDLFNAFTAGLGANRPHAPNGNIYIPPSATLPWSEDYTSPTVATADEAVFLHELFHVYQFNTEYNDETSFWRARQRNDNYYYIIGSRPSFADYGIEQQASMVEDRYRARMGLSIHRGIPHPVNGATTLAQLEEVLPFEWANP